MKILPINCCQASPSFGYSHKLKTMWKNDELPTVIKGFYGDTLTKSTVTLEHLKPKSKGGKNTLSNYVLASKRRNELRGNRDITRYATSENVINYLTQFLNVEKEGFNGNAYIDMILKTLGRLGLNIDPEKIFKLK